MTPRAFKFEVDTGLPNEAVTDEQLAAIDGLDDTDVYGGTLKLWLRAENLDQIPGVIAQAAQSLGFSG